MRCLSFLRRNKSKKDGTQPDGNQELASRAFGSNTGSAPEQTGEPRSTMPDNERARLVETAYEQFHQPTPPTLPVVEPEPVDEYAGLDFSKGGLKPIPSQDKLPYALREGSATNTITIPEAVEEELPEDVKLDLQPDHATYEAALKALGATSLEDLIQPGGEHSILEWARNAFQNESRAIAQPEYQYVPSPGKVYQRKGSVHAVKKCEVLVLCTYLLDLLTPLLANSSFQATDDALHQAALRRQNPNPYGSRSGSSYSYSRAPYGNSRSLYSSSQTGYKTNATQQQRFDALMKLRNKPYHLGLVCQFNVDIMKIDWNEEHMDNHEYFGAKFRCGPEYPGDLETVSDQWLKGGVSRASPETFLDTTSIQKSFIIDDTGSMSNWGTDGWATLRRCAPIIADALTLGQSHPYNIGFFDDAKWTKQEGSYFHGTPAKGYSRIYNPNYLLYLFEIRSPDCQYTRIGQSLMHFVDNILGQTLFNLRHGLELPPSATIIIATDGGDDDEEHLVKCILACMMCLWTVGLKPNHINFQFFQVGRAPQVETRYQNLDSAVVPLYGFKRDDRDHDATDFRASSWFAKNGGYIRKNIVKVFQGANSAFTDAENDEPLTQGAINQMPILKNWDWTTFYPCTQPQNEYLFK